MARQTPKAKDNTKKPLNKKKKDGDSGDGGDGDISAAERRADKKQAERDERTGQRYLKQARNLNPQAKALTDAIGEMKIRRRKDMRDIQQTRAGQLRRLLSSAEELGAQYDTAADNNETAAAGALESGMTNAVRERSETLSQLLTQGAGESDTMRAMLMAARNQNSNANEANRAYWDTIASINQSVTTLNEDTQAKLADAWISAEGEKEQIQRDYLESTSDAYTQLGLVRQSQADAVANAKEYEVKIPVLGGKKDKGKKGAKGKGGDSRTSALSVSSGLKGKASGSMKDAARKAEKGVPLGKSYRDRAEKAFDTWADLQDESYKQKKVPGRIENYVGKAQFTGRQSNSELAGAITVEPLPKAEGVTLRKWA